MAKHPTEHQPASSVSVKKSLNVHITIKSATSLLYRLYKYHQCTTNLYNVHSCGGGGGRRGGAHSSCPAQYLSTEPALLMEPARAMLEAR